MDILSLTSRGVGTEAPGPWATSASPSPVRQRTASGLKARQPLGKPEPAVVPQKEATQTGQKRPENLLDLLKKNDASTLTDAQASALSGVKLPPTLADIAQALLALGVTDATGQVQTALNLTANELKLAVSNVELPQSAKDLLSKLVSQAVAPFASSMLIDLARPVTPEILPGSAMAQTLPDPAPVEGPDPSTVQAAATQVVPDPSHEALTATNGTPTLQVVGTKQDHEMSLDSTMVQALNVVAVDQGGPVSQAPVGPAILPSPVQMGNPQTPAPEAGQVDPAILPIVSSVAASETDSGHAAGNTGDGKPVPTAGDIEVVPVEDPKASASAKGTDKGVLPKVEPPKPSNVAPGDSKPAPDAGGNVLGRPSPASGPVTSPNVELAHEVRKIDDQGSNALEPAATTPTSTNVAGAFAGVASTAQKEDQGTPALAKATVDSVQKQIADRIETLVAARKSGSVTIKLQPNDLGTVTLMVKHLGSRVDAEVKASNEQVRLALQAHRQDLFANIETRGLNLGSFHIGQESQGQNQAQSRNSESQDAIRQAQLRTAASNSIAPSPRALRPTLSDGVDFWA